MEHLPQRAKEDLLARAHVCRHTDWGTAVPADQFGEQTCIRQGKGARSMKGISKGAEQVAVCVNSFSVRAHLNIAMEDMYSDAGDEENPLSGADKEKDNQQKEEGEGRRKLDEADRRKITVELEKYIYPLNE